MSQGTNLLPRAGSPGGIKTLLEGSRERIADVLPAFLTPERMIRVTLAAVHRNPKLLQCTPLSILHSMMQASELGLEPNTALQHAYLIPYKNECTFQVGYRGLIELALRTGLFAKIEGRAIFAADTFRLAYDPEVQFHHEPCLEADPGPLIHAYAYARLKGDYGPPAFQIVSRAQVEAARAQSRAPDSLMWTKFYDQGAIKVALRRLLKTQPSSVELARALEIDHSEPERPRGPRPGPTRPADLIHRLEGPPEEPAFREGTAGQIRTEDAGDYDDWGDDDPGEAEPDRTEGT
jgi:recombination protein RecT